MHDNVTHEEFVADDLLDTSNMSEAFLDAEQGIKEQVQSMAVEYGEIDHEAMDELRTVYEDIHDSDYFNDLNTMSQNYIEARINFLKSTLS